MWKIIILLLHEHLPFSNFLKNQFRVVRVCFLWYTDENISQYLNCTWINYLFFIQFKVEKHMLLLLKQIFLVFDFFRSCIWSFEVVNQIGLNTIFLFFQAIFYTNNDQIKHVHNKKVKYSFMLCMILQPITDGSLLKMYLLCIEFR